MVGKALKCMKTSKRVDQFISGTIDAKELKRDQIRLMRAHRIQKLYDLIKKDIDDFTEQDSIQRQILTDRLV